MHCLYLPELYSTAEPFSQDPPSQVYVTVPRTIFGDDSYLPSGYFACELRTRFVGPLMTQRDPYRVFAPQPPESEFYDTFSEAQLIHETPKRSDLISPPISDSPGSGQ
jgi:hypothetical protein